MGYKENQQEQHERYKYKKLNFWYNFFGISILAGMFLYLTIDNPSFTKLMVSTPNLSGDSVYYILSLAFFIGLWTWWNGNILVKKYYKINATIRKYFELFSRIAVVVYIGSSLYQKNLLSLMGFDISSIDSGLSPSLSFLGSISESVPFVESFMQSPLESTINFLFIVFILYLGWIFTNMSFLKSILTKDMTDSISKFINSQGRRKELDDFFFPSVSKTDELPRVRELTKFSGKYDIATFFDFDCKDYFSIDENGTARILDLHREVSTGNVKNKVVVNSKEDNYRDIFLILEGTLTKVYTQLKYKDIESPLKINFKKDSDGKKVFKDYTINYKVDVYDEKIGEVYFSSKMIYDTVKGMSFLFSRYLDIQLKQQGRVKAKYGKELSDPLVIQKINDIFKFVYLRYLLMNYGSMPSGWYAVRLNDYDTRRIISTIDREMIISISSVNDGTSKMFSSDIFANMFLFLWWAFMTTSSVKNVVGDIDWAFNTEKDLNEIKIRNMNQKVNEESKDES